MRVISLSMLVYCPFDSRKAGGGAYRNQAEILDESSEDAAYESLVPAVVCA